MLDDIIRTLPFWILGLGGILMLIIEVSVKSSWRRANVAALITAIAATTILYDAGFYGTKLTSFKGIIFSDALFVFSSLFILLATLLVIFISSERTQDEAIESPGEFYALLLMSSAGAILFANARELISLFLGLEIMSMALYCLCGSAISKRESSESALKYFLLGSFSSAFLLYGIALLYGISGTLFIPDIAVAVASNQSSVLMLSLGFILMGMLFKIGAVPFHFWAPDVYQGAPTSVTAYMATVIKASAVFALIRVLWGIFPSHAAHWEPFIWAVSMMTIIAGNLLALRQRNMKRMLAYSSIAHAGYMLAAFLAPGDAFGGGAGVLFYLASYAAMTLGSFAVLSTLKTPHGSFSFDISSVYGLSKTNPVLALVLSLFMFTLAGLPPGLAGLLGKFFIFSSVVSAGYIGLTIIAMLGSTVSCYYYLRIIVAMYFMSPNSESPVLGVSMMQRAVLGMSAVFCVLLGLFPTQIYACAQQVIAVL
jgi:NADH-quinone oxidoreductase subunit N